MNKRDIKELAKGKKPAAASAAWMQMYASVVGGQVGWIASSLGDDRRLHERLSALIGVTDAALDAAVRAGKIVK